MDNKIMKKSLVRFSCCTLFIVKWPRRLHTYKKVKLVPIYFYVSYVNSGLLYPEVYAVRLLIVLVALAKCILLKCQFFHLFNTIRIMFIYCRRILH